MAAIDDFITHARNNGVDDETIRQTLETQGWDKNVVSFALAGIAVPAPDSNVAVSVPVAEPAHSSAAPSLHPLLAALHHVLLWFFVISSTIAIVAVVASLFGESVDSSALAAMIAVVAITFTPYAILFITYLRKLGTQPNLIPGKVWSIITICLQSLSVLGAAITLVVTAIVGGESSVMVGAALILALTGTVLTVYIFAAFVPITAKVRKPILLAYLPIVALLLGTLFVMSLLRLGPALADENTRKNLVTTVENIQKKVQTIDRLPNTSEAKSLIVGSGITFDSKSPTTYELCATFVTDSETDKYSSYGSTRADAPISDSYVYVDAFYRPSGRQCFVIQSNDLTLINDRFNDIMPFKALNN